MIDIIANRYAEALFQLSVEENITEELYKQLQNVVGLIKENKEYEEMSWFANVVGDESDKDFENAMIKTIEKLKNDNNLITWQKRNDFPSDDSILNYLNEKYFNITEVEDYYKVVTLCDTSTILILESLNDYEYNCQRAVRR